MRLSPIIKKLFKRLFKRLAARFRSVSSTLASANMSAALLSAFFFFSLPAAAEDSTPRLPQKIAAGVSLDKDVTLKDGTVLSAGEVLSKDIYVEDKDGKYVESSTLGDIFGGGKIDMWHIDTTQDFTTGVKSDVGKGSMWFVWNEEEKRFNFTIQAPIDGSKAIQIDYQNVYGDPFSGDPQAKYGWSGPKVNGTTPTSHTLTNGTTYGKDGWSFAVSNGTIGEEILIYNGTQSRATAAGTESSINGKTVYGLTGLDAEGKDNTYPKGGDRKDNSDGTTGGAIFLKTSGVHLDDITASFINNTGKGEKKDHGGAIYISNGSGVNSITGDFIGNHVKSGEKIFGGAIYNLGEIENGITGNFIGNYAYSTGPNTANGGAISNGTETLEPNECNEEAHIGAIVGYFIGNYVTSSGTANSAKTEAESEASDGRVIADVIGGTIVNYGRIDSVKGVFIGNYAQSAQTANSGVLRNYDKQNRAIIGKGLKDSSKDVGKRWGFNEATKDEVVIDGIFINNYAQGGIGDASGGVMRNNGIINGKIQGLYVGNYAKTEGAELKADGAHLGTYNYLRNNNYLKNTNPAQNKGTITRERAGMAYGGVFYNELKQDLSPTVRPYIGDIEATFIDNYVSSTWGEAFGGAIFNRDSNIGTIDSTFVGNHAVSRNFKARGGAIFNDTSGFFTKEKTPDKTAWVGDIGNLGNADKEPVEFAENYAQGKSAQGGAVYVSNGSSIQNIYVSFTQNYVKSIVDETDTQYYYKLEANNRDAEASSSTAVNPRYELEGDGKLRPTAQGGALYVADGASTSNIIGSFVQNWAQTNGVGNVAKSDNLTESLNEMEMAQGGAIYVSGTYSKYLERANGEMGGDIEQNIQDITAEFISNQVENKGNNTKFTNVQAIAQGGALYVNTGKVSNIKGFFWGNHAYGHSAGSKEETVQGGAIYVSAGGSIDDITSVEYNVQGNDKIYGFYNNTIEADGKGAFLETQKAQGGAIFVSAGKVPEYVNGIEKPNAPTKSGIIRDIQADFVGNSVMAKLDGTSTQVRNREVQGGAIYLYNGAEIGSVTEKDRGFYGNTITVEGGSPNNLSDGTVEGLELLAQGGAIYVANKSHAGNIVANFTYNGVTSTSTGNRVEKTGGGAIYVAEKGYIGSIGHLDENDALTKFVDIAYNYVNAGGNGDQLKEQRARGGAILVSSKGYDEELKEEYSVKNITADIYGNSVILNASDKLTENSKLEERYALGGAIYVSNEGVIKKITGKKVGFDSNTITVNGGYSGSSIDLHAWGGALYVEDNAEIDNVEAAFTNNRISTGTIYKRDDEGNVTKEVLYDGADGNKKESLAGGAIYVAGGGNLKNIGAEEKHVSIMGNELYAGGNGVNLTEQEVQGGAFFVGASKLDDGTGSNFGTVGNIFATDIAGNKITAKLGEKGVASISAKENVVTRAAQGGAIYVAAESVIGNITATGSRGISGNTITVEGGNNSWAPKQNLAETESDLVVQGGAIYVNQGGHIGNIVAPSISGNSVTSEAVGNQREYVGGGAIYVNAEGYVGTIGGADEDNVGIIYANKVVASGLSINLEEQRGRGGAILMSQRGTDDYSSKGIYADFVENSILVDVGAGVGANLEDRYALGGAIYLSKEGKIAGDIVGGKYGFYGNTITVNGGVSDGDVTLRAWGGALYVEDNAEIDDIKASFTYNSISTGKKDAKDSPTGKVLKGADGNLSESLAGGALFVAGGAVVGDIGVAAAGKYVSITGNMLYAGGNGVNLKDQEVQGGAIFVGETKLEGSTGTSFGTVGDIYATDIADNKITAKLNEIDPASLERVSKVEGGVTRAAQGGAIYVAAGSVIGNITAMGDGISGNEIMVEGGNNNWKQKDLDAAESDLVVQGGAIYVNEGGNIGNIEASNICFNRAISEAVGNTKEYVGGGAIYINAEGYVGNIDANAVYYNEVIARGKSENLTEQRVRGGAILVSSKNKDYNSMGDINADFVTNLITADLEGNTQNLASRIARGGAIYVDDHGVIGNITAAQGGFNSNVIEVTGGVDGKVNRTLNIDGGALYLNDGAQAGDIDANFLYNAIRSQNENGTKKAGGNTEELMHGGAIYLAAGASIGDIGKVDNVVYIWENSITASGQGAGLTTQEMQGGAIYVSSKPDAGDHSIGNIYADVVKNTITVYAGDSNKLTARTVQGGAIYVDDHGVIGNITAEQYGFQQNVIEVTGGAENTGSVGRTLNIDGGALYLNDGAEAGNIDASFVNNAIRSQNEDGTVKAGGNTEELMHGGAIYLAAGASIGAIGKDNHYVQIESNSITAAGQGNGLTTQQLQGGAIFVTSGDGSDAAGMIKGSIYADFLENKITANGAKNAGVTKREVQGGAIYLASNSAVEGSIYSGGLVSINDAEKGTHLYDMYGKGSGFDKNSIVINGGNANNSGVLQAQGGAIFLDQGGSIQSIRANFTENSVTSEATGNEFETVQGGAIYVAGGGSIANIGHKQDEKVKEDVNAYVLLEENRVVASGRGSKLASQTVQGGAIYLGKAEDAEGKLLPGSIQDLTVVNVSNNMVIVKASGESNGLKKREAQGGAIYLSDGGSLQNITALGEGFTGNVIKVGGGSTTSATELVAQGGAIYVASGGNVGDIHAGFVGNYITTAGDEYTLTEGDGEFEAARGNETETVQGGAIYVAGAEAKIGNIGEAGKTVGLNHNYLHAAGLGSQLASQTVQGGAIFVSRDAEGSGAVQNIYAAITENHILADAGSRDKEGSTVLTERKAQGGAIYLAQGGHISEIHPGKEKGEEGEEISKGFTLNYVKVTGGHEDNTAALTAQGGALYVSESAGAKGIMAGFSNNYVDTSEATGNKSETLGGGAIYMADGATIAGIGTSDEIVSINNNYLKAGGQGANLTTQVALGGAIFLAAVTDGVEESAPGSGNNGASGKESYTIGDVYADVQNNRIDASVTGGGNLTDRTLQGGAIHVAGYGRMGNITSKSGEAGGFAENRIIVTGEVTNEDGAALTAQGGAIYVAEEGGIENIDANFKNNKIVSTATGNKDVLAQGGAIYVSDGARIKNIGVTADEEAKVHMLSISYNTVTIGEGAVNNGDAKQLAQKHAQGGAIYLASKEVESKKDELANKTTELETGSGLDDKTTELKVGSIGKIYADFKGNEAKVENKGEANVEVLAQGGAIYVSKGAKIASIEGDFEDNKAISSGKTDNSSKEWAHGGAIDVADSGEVLGNIEGNFKRNGVVNSGRVAIDEDGNDMHAKGGAIYLADHGSVDRIGQQRVLFEENYAKGSGQVRAGAVFVSDATVNAIEGTFLRNYADGTDAMRTFGGAMRFDQSTIVRLDSNFIQNWTTGTGGGLSLTSGGVIYEVSGDFLGNTSRVNGGGVDALGEIGQRGWMATNNEKRPDSIFSNIEKDDDGKPMLERDSTDVLKKDNGSYKNKQGQSEYDGSFTGGFVNSNFLYNTVHADDADVKDKTNKDKFHGGGIYTDKDLFITVNNFKEVIMSGNKVEYSEGYEEKDKYHRSAIYVDNKDYKANAGDYESIVVYLVARDHGVLRIDDNILGHSESTTGLVLRLRGYADEKHWLGEVKKEEYRDTTGLIILNNRVEKTNTIMDDVTLYIGYKPRTYISGDYFNNTFDGKEYGKVDTEMHEKGKLVLTPKDAFIGDEDEEDILMDGKRSQYLDEVGTVTAWKSAEDGKWKSKDSEKGTEKRSDIAYIHQSDIFRDSSLTVRSGTVALTEHTYATKVSENDDGQDRFTDMNSDGKGADSNGKKTDFTYYRQGVYTEYLFGNLTAFGVDYNYGLYGTLDDDVKALYLGKDEDGNILPNSDKNDLFERVVDVEKGHVHYEAKVGDRRYASFEFNMGFGDGDVYELELKHKYYYVDLNGNATENSFQTNMDGSRTEYVLFRQKGNDPEYNEDGDLVHVKRRMASSDVLTVFAVMDDKGNLVWDKTSKGRITLNGLTVQMSASGNWYGEEEDDDDEDKPKPDGWSSTNQSVSGAQTDKHFELDEDGNYKDVDGVLKGDGFNRDLYVQLINYMLVDEKGNLITKEADLKKFFDKFDEEEDEDNNPQSGYHLLRLSDHFDLVHEAMAYMKGSDILADEIELATTWTKDDSIRVVNWRDHLAEWAEHEGSWDWKKDKEEVEREVVKEAPEEEPETPEEPGDDTPGGDNSDLAGGETDTGDTGDGDNSGIGNDGNSGLVDNSGTDNGETGSGETGNNSELTEGSGEGTVTDGLAMASETDDVTTGTDGVTTDGVTPENGDVTENEPVNGKVTVKENRPKDTANLYDGKKRFVLDQNVYYLNRNINIEPNPTMEGHDPTGAAMWGKYLTIEGLAKWRTLDLQRYNMLSIVIPDQQVRLQSHTLVHVQNDHIENQGDLILDTMALESSLTINNAGNGLQDGQTLNNQLTATGVMDINFTVTTEGETLDTKYSSAYGKDYEYYETKQHGEFFINHTTEVKTSAASNVRAAGEDGDMLLNESVIHILNTVEHQNITHQGALDKDGKQVSSDEIVVKSEKRKYTDVEDEQVLDTWYIEKGHVDRNTWVRETFKTNTYLDTTSDGYKATPQFKAFVDNSLRMEGGAFNLGTMYLHRLKLRDFRVQGGGVFVEKSTIDLEAEVMGGIDARGTASCLVDERYEAEQQGKPFEAEKPGTGDGLIWLEKFEILNSNEAMIVHVKFVDDGVGDTVKDSMGIANGIKKSGMRIMKDGLHKYEWEVTYNDEAAVNKRENPDWVGIRGMYTFRRRGWTDNSFSGPVTDLTGSFVTMMQVYNYSFEHSDLYSTSMREAREQQLYADHYSAVDVKGAKGAPAPARETCPATTAGMRRGMWLHTYSSTEHMPLRNGPRVSLTMYGGLIGGDSKLTEHRNGWASVWSFYGGYLGSTQRYSGMRIRQNGAAIGGTGTFYKKSFYTALTASVGGSQARSSSSDGHDDVNMLMGGIASRSGYSFRVDGGRYVIQPNVQLSYTMFNTFDYTNTYGARVKARPTGVFQVHPFVKVIKNTDCTWKPYATVGVVYNVFGKTRYTYDGSSLPSMSIKPYAEYSIGAQRTWNDTYTIYGQVIGRNGGRNGVEFNAGLRYAW